MSDIVLTKNFCLKHHNQGFQIEVNACDLIDWDIMCTEQLSHNAHLVGQTVRYRKFMLCMLYPFCKSLSSLFSVLS